MKEKIKLLNYKNDSQEVEIDDFENVSLILLKVVTGDELLEVIYEGGKVKKIDPWEFTRMADYPDYEYDIFDRHFGYDDLVDGMIFEDEWINRADSYEFEDKVEEFDSITVGMSDV